MTSLLDHNGLTSTGAGGRRLIGVLGAGAAGLTFAREVERAGHRAVVLEASSTVGGPCKNVTVDGRSYDLCGRTCSKEYDELAELIKKMGIITEATQPVLLYRHRERAVVPFSVTQDSEIYRAYTSLQARVFPRIGDAGLAHSAQALHQPALEWLTEHGLHMLTESIGTFYTAAGFGYLRGDVPALYLAKLAMFTGLFTNSPTLFGHPYAFTVTGGFAGLWERVAAELNDVRCGTPVTAVKRGADGVRLHLGTEVLEVDDIVLTVALDLALPLLDATAEEVDIASRIRRVDYYTTLCRISGLPQAGFYLIADHARLPEVPGRCVAFHSPYPDTDWYVCYSYGGGGLEEQAVAERLREEIVELGGELEEVRVQQRWGRMPHFGSADVAGGIYERLEAMQGVNRTFHAGSLPAFELNETNVSYARSLARRFFSAEPMRDATGAAL